MKRRASGILLHLSSLPSPFGIGDMGESAYRFADFLSESGQSYWQLLPLNPSDLSHGNSPYHSTSAFACNPLLISPELLAENGLLTKADLKSSPDFPGDRVDFPAVTAYKETIFNIAFERFRTRGESCEYELFCRKNADWLDDFLLFSALKSHFRGRPWCEWHRLIRDRRREALQLFKKKLCRRIEKERFLQYVFSRQWSLLKDYCNMKGVQIIGDIPIYMPYDSVDIWVNPEIFKLDKEKKPLAVSGVPPDYFSSTGQLWGHPVYRWKVLEERGYDWWVRRFKRNLELFDFVRIDHFRGFVAYWEVPAGEKTAKRGKWVQAPAEDFFDQLGRKFSCLPIIAEDLGTITPEVREVMRRFEFPGMKLLLFAFGDDFPTGSFLPHNFEKNCVAYTGTHDNNTVRGWFEMEAKPEEKKRLISYLGHSLPADELHWEVIRLVMMSVANVVIFPMQDILGLDARARMNRPAVEAGNWQWRLPENYLSPALSEKLCEMTRIYGRA